MNPIQLSIIDKSIILLYLFTIIAVGLLHSRRHSDSVDNYLLAGRRLSLPAFIATLVSTWYGGILGVGEFTYRYGILNWVTQGLPYYVFALLFALFLAPKIRKSSFYTIPDQLYHSYGKIPGILGSIIIFILVSPASYFLMTALLLSFIFNIPFWVAFSIAVIFSMLYVYLGGFQSVVNTDIVQFILMFMGFFILVLTLLHSGNGLAVLKSDLPATHLKLFGESSFQYVIVWFFIALWTFVDPGFYQRCYAARTPHTARLGILISILFWMVFDLLTTISGLFARALFPGIEPLLSFPILGDQILPDMLKGLFFVGMLATIMSTLDSSSFIAAVTFGRDIVWRCNKEKDTRQYTRLGLLVAIAVSIILILFFPSVVKIWYTLGTLCIPPLLIPLISNFNHRLRMSPKGATICIAGTFLITLLWFLVGIYRGDLKNPFYLWQIQPFYTGLFISIVIYIVDQFKHRQVVR
jgi:SSS family solute:Na+ symporter